MGWEEKGGRYATFFTKREEKQRPGRGTNSRDWGGEQRLQGGERTEVSAAPFSLPASTLQSQ